MKLSPLLIAMLAAGLPPGGWAADRMTVAVENGLAAARPAETIEVPWTEIARRLPDTLPSHLVVKDATGTAVAHQLLNSKPEEHRDNYESLIFQHDFAPGERTAVFTVEKTASPVPPYPAKVFARYVPERFDDFAWENDRVAHRVYGPMLGTPAAGGTQMFSSGIDVWCKRVRYPIIDRWYLMGHYHEDTGEGLDLYDVGKSRGCGGIGLWDGKTLRVSKNWTSWKVLANGPVRVVVELTYVYDAVGGEQPITETKRITLDAGQNLDRIESAFRAGADEHGAITAALGVAKHKKNAGSAHVTKNEQDSWLSLWEDYEKNGQLGTAVLCNAAPTEFGEDETNHLLLVKAKPGQPLHYYTGAGWTRSGDFADQASWEKYLTDFAARLKSPLRVTYPDAK